MIIMRGHRRTRTVDQDTIVVDIVWGIGHVIEDIVGIESKRDLCASSTIRESNESHGKKHPPVVISSSDEDKNWRRMRPPRSAPILVEAQANKASRTVRMWWFKLRYKH